MNRRSRISRQTRETNILVELDIDGKGVSSISSPIGFLNHMLEALSKHGLFDLKVNAQGDIHVDQHHLVEDLAIVLGRAFQKALGDKKGIQRAGFFIYPMDDALALVAVDLSGRPYLQFDVEFRRQFCGDFDTDLTKHFFEALSVSMGANLVIKLMAGENDHHKLEAIFKALAKALKLACSLDPRASDSIPSTKEVLD